MSKEHQNAHLRIVENLGERYSYHSNENDLMK